MGDLLSAISSKCKQFNDQIIEAICPSKKPNNYSFTPIDFGDEEQHAPIMTNEELNKIIQKHQQFEEKKGVNLNEYRMLQTNEDDDEFPPSKTRLNSTLKNSEFEQLKNDIKIDVSFDSNKNESFLDKDKENVNNSTKNEDEAESIEELKRQFLDS